MRTNRIMREQGCKLFEEREVEGSSTLLAGYFKILESELGSDFQESLLPPKPGMYAENVATAPKAM